MSENHNSTEELNNEIRHGDSDSHKHHHHSGSAHRSHSGHHSHHSESGHHSRGGHHSHSSESGHHSRGGHHSHSSESGHHSRGGHHSHSSESGHHSRGGHHSHSSESGHHSRGGHHSHSSESGHHSRGGHHSHHSGSHSHSRSSIMSKLRKIFRPHKKSRRHNSNRFGGVKPVLRKLSDKLSLKNISAGKQLKKMASSQKADKRKSYVIRSRRILFCVAIIAVFIYSFFYISSDNEDAALKTAGYTPSETTQLRSQVMILEAENAKLKQQLEQYIALYGELETQNAQNNTAE